MALKMLIKLYIIKHHSQLLLTLNRKDFKN